MDVVRDGGWVLIVDADDVYRRRAGRVLGQWVQCRTARTSSEASAVSAEIEGLVAAVVALPSATTSSEEIAQRTSFERLTRVLHERYPSLDVRVLVSNADDLIATIRDASTVGASVMWKGDVEDLEVLGPIFASAAEAERRRLADRRVEETLGHLARAHDLSKRQREILHLKARNLTNEQIAAELGLTVKAIEHHSSKAVRDTGRSLRQWAREASVERKIPSATDRRARNV